MSIVVIRLVLAYTSTL